MHASPANQYGIILLAAGSSSRLGKPKQLLVYKGDTLVKKAAEIALKVTGNVMVVTGANEKNVRAELESLPIYTIENNFFEEGIASSIRIGLNSLLNYFPEIQSVIFIVCDQPFISVELLCQLIERKEKTNKGIIACQYDGTLGTPILFQQKFFEELLLLEGDAGAKKITYQHSGEVEHIEFPLGAMDIDTIEDYELLLRKKKQTKSR
jgi:molybdenum cofactor cytidylyltransferase